MKCPFCVYNDNKVIDSRLSKDGDIIRRRRECNECGRRFTTYERIEEVLPLIIKKDGRRETFSRTKILAGIGKACEKRPISVNQIEKMVDRLEHHFQECGEKEVSSSIIGEEVMKELYGMDQVAYVRFASVYRQFRDINHFMSELKEIIEEEKRIKTDGKGADKKEKSDGKKYIDSRSQGKLF